MKPKHHFLLLALLSPTVFAAPVVVQPGDAAGYLFFPKPAATGGGGTGRLVIDVMQVAQTFCFTGTGTFNPASPPPGTIQPFTRGWLQVIVVGGGGGGAGGRNNRTGGGGGGSGYIKTGVFRYTGGTFQVTVGRGGAPVSPGESSSFTYTSSLVADGGGGGIRGQSGGAGGYGQINGAWGGHITGGKGGDGYSSSTWTLQSPPYIPCPNANGSSGSGGSDGLGGAGGIGFGGGGGGGGDAGAAGWGAQGVVAVRFIPD